MVLVILGGCHLLYNLKVVVFVEACKKLVGYSGEVLCEASRET
jgi:hypothetical protein